MIDLFTRQVFVLGALYFLDVLSTYLILSNVQKQYPKMQSENLESNFIMRFLLKKFGKNVGAFLGMVAISPIWLLVIVGVSFNPWIFYFMLGVYTVTFMLHLENLKGIINKKDAWWHEMYVKAYETQRYAIDVDYNKEG